MECVVQGIIETQVRLFLDFDEKFHVLLCSDAKLKTLG